jgi:hypothetical protein
MIRHGSRWAVGVALLAALLSRAPAQEGKDAPAKDKQPPAKEPEAPAGDEYRQFFKKPQTAMEFWKAIQFELEVGRPDLAASALHGLLESKPPDEALAALVDREGMAALLRLRNIKWASNLTPPDLRYEEAEIARLQASKQNYDRLNELRDRVNRARKEYQDALATNARADKDVDALLAAATEAVRKVRGDPRRIAELVGQLNASPEENAYALKELYKSGALAVPALIDALRPATGADRAAFVNALARLGPDAVPPMAAALDGDDVQLKVDLLDVLRRRGSREVVPNLWYLAAAPREQELVRRKATDLLAVLLETQASRLPPAKAALTREAERYYRHEVLFPDPRAVTVWRWDNGRVVAGWPGAATVPASAAEEYYGVHFADQALALDPTYRPAQVVLLSLVLDKGAERAGLTQPLAKGAPQVHALLATASPDVVDDVLERALDERRTPVVLHAVRTLGGLADPRAVRPTAKGEPVLVRALYYPDRRVQMAAAEALARGPLPRSAAARVLEVLRRALASEPAAGGAPKVLVGYFDRAAATRVTAAVNQAGFEPITVHTGRDVMRRLGQAADIDALLLDSGLPDPGLAGLLGQLNADATASRLPIVLTAPPGREDALRRFTARYPTVFVAPAGIALAPRELQTLLKSRIAEASGGAPLTEGEQRDYAERAVRLLAGLARGEPPGADIRPDGDAILDALRSGKVGPEGQLAAISAAGKLHGPRTQNELAGVILDTRRPPPVRAAAAQELVRHMRQDTVLLTRAQAGALEGLLAQPETDPALKAELALLIGSLRPDARLTGERLLRYQPAPPAAAAPPPALKEEPKEKEKDKDEGKP